MLGHVGAESVLRTSSSEPGGAPELIRERVTGSTVGAWVDQLVAPAPYGFTMPHRNSYDDASQTWTLAALDFSENYDDFTAAVAVFREAPKYKDLPGTDGMLIYSYMFGDSHPSAALRIEMGSATFLSEREAEALIAEGAAANPQEP
jgi:hypothetical protein